MIDRNRVAQFAGREVPGADRPEIADPARFGEAFAVANVVNPVVQGFDIIPVAMAFGMILGAAERTKAVPNPEAVAELVRRAILEWAKK